MHKPMRPAAKWRRSMPDDAGIMQDAHLLLKQHGKTLCKRRTPKCDICPLASVCAWFEADTLRRAGKAG